MVEMKFDESKARIALLSLSIILVLISTVSGQVRIDSTSQSLNNGSFRWRIFIQADEATLSNIDCVEYRLDPSFAKPVRKVCKRGDPNYLFAESGEALKSFKTNVAVYFKNRPTMYSDYTVRLTLEIPVSPQVRIRQNTSKLLDQNPFQNKVAVYISAGNAKRFRLKIYENSPLQRAFFEAEMYSDKVKANFHYNNQPYVLRGYTKGPGANFDLYCTVYRELVK